MTEDNKGFIKKILKGAVVVGAGVYTGNLFTLVVPAEQGILVKAVAGFAGTAIGGWLGLEAANGIEYRLTEAVKKLDAQQSENVGVKVNG